MFKQWAVTIGLLLARELNIPILVLAQLSRAVESRLSKVPQLSDLRGRRAFEILPMSLPPVWL